MDPKIHSFKEAKPVEDEYSKKSIFSPERRRSSATSIKSLKSLRKASISSSRRGSKVDSCDEYDDDEVPNIPNITFRKGSIVSAFPITDDLPCMRNKRHSLSSVSSERSEEMPPIVFRKGSISVIYSVPDLLSLDASIREDSQEAVNDEKDDKQQINEDEKPNSGSGQDSTKVVNINFNEIIALVGDFNKYQFYLLICLIPFLISYVFLHASHRFLTILPEEYWCHVPELSNLTLELRLNLSIPNTAINQPDHCFMYNVNYSNVLSSSQLTPDANWSLITCYNGWDYNMNVIPYSSIAVQDNWVCENQSNISISQSLFLAGSIVGALVFGRVADKYGRILAIIGSSFLGVLGGILTAFTSTFVYFAICRFLTGIAFYNAFIFLYIIVLENVSSKRRTFAISIMFFICYSLADVVVPWIAFYVSDWRWFSVIVALTQLVGLILTCFLPESPRWQFAKGQIDNSINTLKKIEKINKSKVDPKNYTHFKESFLTQYATHTEDTAFSVIDIFRTEKLRKHVYICIVAWMSIWFTYNGISTTNYGLDPFTTFSILSLTDLPAFLIVLITLDVLGRKWLTFGALFITGISLLLTCIHSSGQWLLICGLIGRLCANISHLVVIQYASELLPTLVRGQGLALIHICGCVASLASPLFFQFSLLDSAARFIILGLIGMFGALVCIFLPETLEKQLPDTLDQSKTIQDEIFFDIPCCRKQ